MSDNVTEPSALHLDGFDVVDVLDSRRNMVYRVRRSGGSGPTIAVKVLKPEFEPILPGRHRAGSKKLIRSLKRSGGWAPILGMGTTGDGFDYLALPYYPDGSLLDLLGRADNWRRSLCLIGHAAAVVGQLGVQGLALGCLRPSYLLVDTDRVVISAFGMSTRRFDDGTTQYRAPEQHAGSEATPASDVYSLGVILAELLAGRQRRPDESAHDLLASLPDPNPAGLVDLLDHATSSQVPNRIANAALLHRAITRLALDIADDTSEPAVNGNSGPGPGSSVDDHGDASALITPVMPRREDVESGREARPLEIGGPLGDLLDSRITRPTVHLHRPTATGQSAADARWATELELEAMIETLSGLPSGSGEGGLSPDRQDCDVGDDDPQRPDDGGSGMLGRSAGSGRSHTGDTNTSATNPGGPGSPITA